MTETPRPGDQPLLLLGCRNGLGYVAQMRFDEALHAIGSGT